jgi:hypothetical protein
VCSYDRGIILDIHPRVNSRISSKCSIFPPEGVSLSLQSSFGAPLASTNGPAQQINWDIDPCYHICRIHGLQNLGVRERHQRGRTEPACLQFGHILCCDSFASRSARHLRCFAFLERQENASPQLTGLADSVRKLDVRHAGILVASHCV